MSMCLHHTTILQVHLWGPFDVHIRCWFGNKESKLDYKTHSTIRGVYLLHRQGAIISSEKVRHNGSVEMSQEKRNQNAATWKTSQQLQQKVMSRALLCAMLPCCLITGQVFVLMRADLRFLPCQWSRWPLSRHCVYKKTNRNDTARC